MWWKREVGGKGGLHQHDIHVLEYRYPMVNLLLTHQMEYLPAAVAIFDCLILRDFET